jgi:hypothetical protein
MKFFPSLSSWVHAAELCIPAYAGVLLFPFFFWSAFLLSIVSTCLGDVETSIILLISAIGMLLMGVGAYQLILLLYGLVLKVFWTNPPRAIAPPKFKASLHSFGILTFATLPLAIIYCVIIAAEVHVETSTGMEIMKRPDFMAHFLMRFFWLWLIAAAYLYQWFPLQRRQQKPAMKSV